jgi:hypothetical protein
MLRLPRAPTARICVLAIAFLAMRTTSAHAHLCFDGNEPPASVHVADDFDAHHPSDHGTNHSDLDVDLTDTVVKKSNSDRTFDLPFVVRTALVQPPLIRTALPRPPSLIAGTVNAPRMRPPLRAPPL